jgi:hypothetical protein
MGTDSTQLVGCRFPIQRDAFTDRDRRTDIRFLWLLRVFLSPFVDDFDYPTHSRSYLGINKPSVGSTHHCTYLVLYSRRMLRDQLKEKPLMSPPKPV